MVSTPAADIAALAREAADLAEAEEYAAGLALALRTLGIHRYLSGADYEGALEHFQRAMSLLDQAEEARGRGDLLNGMGNVHWRRGDYPEAMRMHLRALEIQRAGGDRAGEGHSLNALGNVSYHLGDYGQALDYYQASLKLRREIGDHLGVAYCLNNVGNIHGQMGESERALRFVPLLIGGVGFAVAIVALARRQLHLRGYCRQQRNAFRQHR